MQKFQRTCQSATGRVVLAVMVNVLLSGAAHADGKDEQISRGKSLYTQACAPCHQLQGQGTPGAFPPLAGSDFLATERDRAIRGLCEGLNGVITVKGVSYNGFMPPAVLNDQQLADVLTFVLNSWDNGGGSVSPEHVKKIRSKTEFKTYEASLQSSEYQPLPKPPEGWTLREVARMPEHIARLASDGKGKTLYALSVNGDIWKVDIASGELKQILWGARYIDLKRGDPLTTGFTLDSQGRFWIACNQRDNTVVPNMAEVTIFRTSATEDGDPAEPKPWFVTHYPWGTGNHHGVNYIGFGPDGYLYVTSGSRTDGNDPALNDPNIAHVGEVPLTCCLWRFDPKAEHLTEPEIYARGLRNTYGMCWNDKGELFGTENGPNADAPEELNLIEKGKHYGFPYKFSNWEKKPYPYTPNPPPGLEFTLPIPNMGPDACLTTNPIYTFDPHSSPAGIVYLGDDFPPDYRGTFLTVRFGILIKQPVDYGFDLLQVRLHKDDSGKYVANVNKMLAPLARPLDVLLAGKGKVYINEYTRTIRFKDSLALPGRILELAVKQSGSEETKK